MCVGESAVFSSHAPVLLNVLFVGVMAQVNKSSSDPETFAKEKETSRFKDLIRQRKNDLL